MSKSTVVFEGVEYSSKTAYAEHLMSIGKTMSEAAKAAGITYQTVLAGTKGKEKVHVRRKKYQALRLARTGKYAVGEIAKRTGTATIQINTLLKKAGIKPMKKEEIAAKKKKIKSNVKRIVK